MSMASVQLRERVAAVYGEIAAARRMVGAGRPVDLHGLDGRLAALCQGIAVLARDEARSFVPLLEDLQESLDQLAVALKAGAPAEESGARQA